MLNIFPLKQPVIFINTGWLFQICVNTFTIAISLKFHMIILSRAQHCLLDMTKTNCLRMLKTVNIQRKYFNLIY